MDYSEKIEFYKDLSDREKELLSQGISRRTFIKGEQIHGDGGECSGVLIVLKGKIRAYMLSEEGREITLYYLEEGETCIMSASCVMNCIAFEVHIEADSDVEVLQIASAAFSAIEKNNLKVANFALKLAVERFSDVMWAMQQLLFFSMDKRLAMYLYDETSKAKTNVLCVTHEEIAKSLASAREVVTRLLQNFQRDGLVKLSRGEVTVLNKGGLAKILD
ncbi:Crp/Fnr family transcriptional regulator [bacterium]|nr:Crp/Fnr family transcriptional regulator [bacterium]